MEYTEALDWLYTVNRFGPERDLEPTRHVFNLMGNPQNGYKIIHVGGSNGKGSTCAYISSILQAAGHKVGLFISPHLEDFTERVMVNGDPIPQEEAARLLTEIRELFEEMLRLPDPMPLRFFDIVAAMAVKYFKEQQVDYAVLEVGLGGRLDATNVVDPLVSVITNIGYEHTNILGDTLELIAFEKAGIIKQGRPVVTADRKPNVLQVIEQKAAQEHAPVIKVGTDTTYSTHNSSIDGQSFSYHGLHSNLDELFTPLIGRHQVTNAATALTAIEALRRYGVTISEEAFRAGVRNVEWPARLEVVHKNPIVVLDCAKDAEATLMVKEAVQRDFTYSRLIAVVSMSRDKKIPRMIDQVAAVADEFIVTMHSVMNRAADPETIAAEVTRNGKPYTVIPNELEAFQEALHRAKPEDMVLVIGSVFLAGSARRFFRNQLSA